MGTKSPTETLPDILVRALEHRRLHGADAMTGFFGRCAVQERKLIDLWLVRNNHALARREGPPVQRFRLLIEELFAAQEAADGEETEMEAGGP